MRRSPPWLQSSALRESCTATTAEPYYGKTHKAGTLCTERITPGHFNFNSGGSGSSMAHIHVELVTCI